MRRRSCALALALAFALAGLAWPAGDAGAAQPLIVAQSETEAPPDDGPTQPSEERPDPSEETPEPADMPQPQPDEEIQGPDVPPRAGETRRIDPFDAVDDDAARTPHPAALAHPEHDVVVCEAGCDKTAGSIVFMRKRE
jgi:hypothetical protein